MSKPLDCLIIGAGIVGLAAARRLALAGRRVLVLDRGGPGGEASGAAAGLLAPQIEAEGHDPILPLALAARDAYPALISELREAGHTIEHNRSGVALVAFDVPRAAQLRDAASAAPPGLTLAWLEPAELRRRQPFIGAEAVGALLALGDGAVDNPALCAALAADALRHGARFESTEVRGVTSQHGRVTGVDTAAGPRPAPLVVLAAGAWSECLTGLPRPLPVRPVRGQMIAVPWPANVPRTLLFGRGAYVVPRGADALLGSTMEDAGFEKATTPEGLAHIRRETARLLPVLEGLAAARTWSGLRPVTSDGHPVLGRDPDLEGLLYATGHGRNGILLGPLTGDIVAEIVLTGETRRDLAPYLISRF